MKPGLRFCLLVLLLLQCQSTALRRRSKRAVSKSLADVLNKKSEGNTKKKSKPVSITPPLKLGPGETAEQAPGWKHCIKDIKASLSWKSIKSPGYPDFLESQIQCSWIIEAPIGMNVKVAFRDLDMIGNTGSCAKQFVNIIDIATGKSQGRFCGNTRPGDYVTMGTKARLDLQADKAFVKVRGFYISFVAVKEIPGFRSTKTFPSMGKGGNVAPGKVDISSFASNSKPSLPKPPPGTRRANRKLIYASDRQQARPRATGSTSSQQQPPQSSSGDETENDFGWIGNDADLETGSQQRNPSGGSPLKVRPTQRRPRVPLVRQPDGSIVIQPRTLPVRIRAKPPRPTTTAATKSPGPLIYGKDDQHHIPAQYTTRYPVRMDMNRFVDHRDETLSTTELIIIIACAALFFVILIGMGIFLWYVRKRRAKRRRRRKEEERRRNNQKQEQLEMNVARLLEDKENDPGSSYGLGNQEIGRRDYLPGPPLPVREVPPDSPHREYSERGPSPPNAEFSRRPSGNDRGVRQISRMGVSFQPRLSNERTDDRDRERNQRMSVNTISQPGVDLYPGDMDRRPLNSDYRVHPGGDRRPNEIPHNTYRNEAIESYPRNNPPHHDGYDYSAHRPDYHEQRPPSPHRHSGYPVEQRHRTAEARRDPRQSSQQNRFHSLDPRYLKQNHQSARRNDENTDVEARIEYSQPHRGRQHQSSRNRSPENRRTSIRNHSNDDVDEDYCSGNSEDESGSGKAPMRREYSQWELEQQKKDRKRKLIVGK